MARHVRLDARTIDLCPTRVQTATTLGPLAIKTMQCMVGNVAILYFINQPQLSQIAQKIHTHVEL